MAIEYYLSNAGFDSAIVKCKATLGLSTTLEYSVNSDFSGSITTAAETPVSGDNFIATFSLVGLSPTTQYYFRAIENLVTDTDSGKFKTMAAPGVPQNIKFAFSGDADDTNNSQSFANVAALTDIDFYLCTGDIHYGDVTTNTEAAFFVEYDGVFTQPNQKSMYESHALLYAWDDHDYGADNSNGSSPSKVSAAGAFRKVIPTNTLVNTSGSIESVTVYGRVKFILLDNRYERGGITILGTTQKDWLLDQIEESANNDGIALTIVSTGVPWIATNEADTWSDATAERTEISNKIFNEGLEGQVAFICGDMHAITHDDGTNNTFDSLNRPGWPVFQSAPMGRTGSTKGGPYSGTVFEGDTDGQYSTIEILDDGLSVTVNVVGLDKNQAELYTYSFDVDAVAATGFNQTVRPLIAVTDVVRTSDTEVTITLPAATGYDIASDEIVTSTMPNEAMTVITGDIVAEPPFTISPYTTGFNSEVRDQMAVTDVVRTNDTTVTITLPASPGYDIDVQEVVSSTMPSAATVLSGDDILAAPTFTIDPASGSSVVVTIDETGNASDAVQTRVVSRSLVIDFALATDTGTGRATVAAGISDGALAADAEIGQGFLKASLVESANGLDLISIPAEGITTLTVDEAGSAVDAVQFKVNFAATLVDGALATDTTTGSATLQAALNELANAVDQIAASVPGVYSLSIDETATGADSVTGSTGDLEGVITATLSVTPLIKGTVDGETATTAIITIE